MALVKYNNNSISAITSTGLTAGAMTLIKEQTASSSSTIDFVDGTSDVVLDNTYPIYLFKLINIHPATDAAEFQVNFRDGGSNYDATKTTTAFQAIHDEGNTSTSLNYETAEDVAQGTGVQNITVNSGADNDQAGCGEMYLFNPSSTTFVKHFIAGFSNVINNDQAVNSFSAGYFNTTSAIDEIQFKYSSGNIDAGDICLYGIK